MAAAGILVLATWAGTIVAICVAGGKGAEWFAAIGTTLAIVAAVALAFVQFQQHTAAEAQRRADLGAVAYDLAERALTLVTERLEACLAPKRPGRKLELREFRTTETVTAMREIEPHTLPPEILAAFIEVRSCVYAINSQVSKIYLEASEAEKAKKAYDQYGELASAVRVHSRALKAFDELGDFALGIFKIEKKAPAKSREIENYKFKTE